MNSPRGRVAVLFVVFLSAAALTTTAHAATITVDHAGCDSLVDAIAAANGDTTVSGCGPGLGADTILLIQDEVFSAVDNTGANGPNGLPVITTDVTISGSGGNRRIARDTVGPPPVFRLFEVTAAGRLRLEDVTLENGRVVGGTGGSGTAGLNGGQNSNGGSGGTGGTGSEGRGGAVLNLGVLELLRVRLVGNQAQGGDGGTGGAGGDGGFALGNLQLRGGGGGTGGVGGAGRGGAVYSSGELRVAATRFEDNRAAGGQGGNGGGGGAAGSVSSFQFKGGHGGNGGGGGTGGEAQGGDLYLSASAVATIYRSLSTGADAAGGNGGGGGGSTVGRNGSPADADDPSDGGDGGHGGSGGMGGASRGGSVFSASSDVRLTESAIRTAEAIGGNGGGGSGGSEGGYGGNTGTGAGGVGGNGGAGGAGGRASGGALAGVGGIERSEISNTSASAGIGGPGGGGGDSGGNGNDNFDNGGCGGGGDGGAGGTASGGGIAAYGGALEVTNVTLSVNGAFAGDGGGGGSAANTGNLIGTSFEPSGDGGNAGDALGGGAWTEAGATAEIRHATVSHNSVNAGAAGAGGTCSPFCGSDGAAGALGTLAGSGLDATATLSSALVSDNSASGGTADQCAGTLTSQGGNLASDASCNLTQGNDQPSETGADLQALADNGGPELPDASAPATRALGATSTAIDQGDCGTPALALDQRRFSRDSTCDVGAFEDAASEFTALPTLNLALDATFQLEGNAGDTARTLTTTLSLASAAEVMVDLTAGGTATPGNDFSDPSTTLSFFPGVVSITTPFDVHGDTTPEPTEVADFNLLNPADATIGQGLQSLTIVNDDGPTVTVADPTVVEGDGGSVQLLFTVQLSAPAPADASISYQSFDDDATDGVDYTGVSGVLQIPESAQSVDLPVDVHGDLDPEFDERFSIIFFTPNHVMLSDGSPATQIQPFGTIEDDDQAAITLTVTSTDPGSAFDQAECLPGGHANLVAAGGPGDLTLREAICIANNTRLDDTIVLADTTYNLTEVDNRWYGPNGLPPIADRMTIQGNGAVIERDGAASPFRFFFVSRQALTDALPDGWLTLENLTLRNGLAKGGNSKGGGGGAGMGGAVLSQGTLELDSVTIEGNTAEGGDSGDATAGNGGGGIGETPTGEFGGGFGGPGPIAGGYGGAAGGARGCSSAGGGAGFGLAAGGGASCFAPGGAGGGTGTTGGRGGYFGSTDPSTLRGTAGDGGGGAGADASCGQAVSGGAFAFGGTTNSTSGGGGGVGGGGGQGRACVFDWGGGGGGFGAGGGARSEGGGAGGDTAGGEGGFGGGGGYGKSVSAGGFGGGTSNTAGAGGAGAGMGGALFNHTGAVTCLNSTLSGNTARGGDTVNAGGGGGLGGAIFNLDGEVTLTHCTLAANRVEAGDGGASGTDGAAAGGGVYNRRQDPGLTDYGFTYPEASITVFSTILGDSVDGAPSPIADCAFSARTGGDALAQITSGGQNLVEGAGSCTFGGTGDLSADPQLGALGDHGGGKETHRPTVGSPAIDAAATCSLTVDERGFARPAGAQCDIGAVEVGFSYSVSDVSAAEGSGGGTTNFVFQVTRIGDVDLPGSVSVSTDPVAPTTSGVDYSALSGFLVSFAANESSQPVTVLVSADGLFEPDDVFHLDLSGASAPGAIGDSQGVGTIQNDDIISYQYYTSTPCRVVDTRSVAHAPALAAGVARDFAVAGTCGIPMTAVAVALNVTVVSPTAAGELAMSAGASTSLPVVSYGAGQTRASNVVLGLAAGGTLRVLADQPSGTVHVILDVAGYFQ